MRHPVMGSNVYLIPTLRWVMGVLDGTDWGSLSFDKRAGWYLLRTIIELRDE